MLLNPLSGGFAYECAWCTEQQIMQANGNDRGECHMSARDQLGNPNTEQKCTLMGTREFLGLSGRVLTWGAYRRAGMIRVCSIGASSFEFSRRGYSREDSQDVSLSNHSDGGSCCRHDLAQKSALAVVPATTPSTWS